MKTLKQVPYIPVSVETITKPLIQGELYISEEYNSAIHLCLCGCGNETVTPLGGGEFWTLVKEKDGTVSLIGSIGNYAFDCKSHYIMTKNIANFI